MTPTEPAPAPRPGPGPLDYVVMALKAVSSLRLTVWLLAAGVALVFFGTVAQMEFGIWTVVDQYFWSYVVWVPTDLFRQFGTVFLSEWFPKEGPRWTGTFPFPAGKLLGGAMLVNLLAAHAVRFRLTWKRSGVIILHSGLILLFVGEFITREYAIEQRMSIREGASANFTIDHRHMELAFVTPDGPEQDKVIVIPDRLLTPGAGKVSAPELPVDVEVLDYFSNSRMEKVSTASKSNRATVGIGRGLIATKDAEVSGADASSGRSDLPAAYVRLFDKESGKDIGTYLVGAYITHLGGHDDVAVGGKTYAMTLRNIRYYKPYSVKLIKFTFDRYPGTQKPKNFASDIILTDNDGSELNQVVKMNDPLRHRGETFYQSSFDPDEAGTVLAVVQNPGWLIPYLSCTLVSVGLLLHFGIHLTQFLKRRAAA